MHLVAYTSITQYFLHIALWDCLQKVYRIDLRSALLYLFKGPASCPKNRNHRLTMCLRRMVWLFIYFRQNSHM